MTQPLEAKPRPNAPHPGPVGHECANNTRTAKDACQSEQFGQFSDQPSDQPPSQSIEAIFTEENGQVLVEFVCKERRESAREFHKIAVACMKQMILTRTDVMLDGSGCTEIVSAFHNVHDALKAAIDMNMDIDERGMLSSNYTVVHKSLDCFLKYAMQYKSYEQAYFVRLITMLFLPLFERARRDRAAVTLGCFLSRVSAETNKINYGWLKQVISIFLS